MILAIYGPQPRENMMRRVCLLLLIAVLGSPAYAQDDVRILATNKTSTMEQEMNEAADAGYRFAGVMGGDTSFGGSEVVVLMTRVPGGSPSFAYKLLATARTSTMQKEMQDAANAGFEYKGQTVFKSTFGGKEVVVVLERDKTAEEPTKYEYRLLATKRTSTLQKEISQATAAGYAFVGLTVANTAIGGDEIVTILRKRIP
jgi:opacity protein-like surface antigen